VGARGREEAGAATEAAASGGGGVESPSRSRRVVRVTFCNFNMLRAVHFIFFG